MQDNGFNDESQRPAPRFSPSTRFKFLFVCLIIAALAFRLGLALLLPNDESGDGVLYEQLAVNLLAHGAYSIETKPPFDLTLIRAPGYPLILAGIYGVFGLRDNTAVRVVQAMLDTGTCLLVALLCLMWMPSRWSGDRRRRAVLWALGAAALCPFTASYVACIMTETWALFLTAATVAAATCALRTDGPAARRWVATGLLGGAAALVRPDCGLLLAAAGAALVVHTLAKRPLAKYRLLQGTLHGFALTLAFCAALSPWAVRNAASLGLFQPLAPPRANMPWEFVPWGYNLWLRTWVTDFRYVPPFEWRLDEEPLRAADLPRWATDSPSEKARVTELFDRYNTHPSRKPGGKPLPMMTPEIDEAFGHVARERIARHPLRQFVLLPAVRAAGLWFGTHSEYYPFEGELFPLRDLDASSKQGFWLPLFAALLWCFTLAGALGALTLWREGGRLWLLLGALVFIPRLAFLATLENPEPRYMVEVLPLVCAAAGLGCASLRREKGRTIGPDQGATLDG